MADMTMWKYCPVCGGEWQAGNLAKQLATERIVCGRCGCEHALRASAVELPESEGSGYDVLGLLEVAFAENTPVSLDPSDCKEILDLIRAAPDDKLREACEALMEYEKAMDGADGCGENDDLYWKAVKLARAALAKEESVPRVSLTDALRHVREHAHYGPETAKIIAEALGEEVQS